MTNVVTLCCSIPLAGGAAVESWRDDRHIADRRRACRPLGDVLNGFNGCGLIMNNSVNCVFKKTNKTHNHLNTSKTKHDNTIDERNVQTNESEKSGKQLCVGVEDRR